MEHASSWILVRFVTTEPHGNFRIQHCYCMACVTAVAQVQSLAQELPHAVGRAKTKTNKKHTPFHWRNEITFKNYLGEFPLWLRGNEPN